MSDYDNNLTGVLFKNDKRETENHPNYKGSAEIDGKQYWLSCWVKKAKNGESFMSLAFTEKDAAKSKPSKAKKADEDSNVLDEEIPF